MAISARDDLRRLIYISTATSDDFTRDYLDIFKQSRANNGLNGVSGFLWTDDFGYVQVLEGTPEAVSTIFERIRVDPRHRDIRIVSDCVESERAFGDWAMASLPAPHGQDALRERVNRFIGQAPDHVRAAFQGAGLIEDARRPA